MIAVAHQRGLELVGGPRWGRQHLGYAPGGAQDRWSQTCVNRLCGNADDAPCLQSTLFAPTMRITADGVVAVGGAETAWRLDGHPVPRWCALPVRAGQLLEAGYAQRGLRFYVAAAGGLRDGGGGRFARAGDAIAAPAAAARAPWAEIGLWGPAPGTLRVLPGPELPLLRIDADGLAGMRWRVGRRSDGMGLRLAGPPLDLAAWEIPSAGVTDGTVQATRGGPILLLRGRQTVGGYPRILQVIEPDLDLAAQLRVGDRVRLHPIDTATAILVDVLRRALLDRALPPAR